MPTLVIKPNASLAVQIDIEDLWFGIAPGSSETFTETDDIKEVAKSRDLPTYLIDDAFGAGNSSLILNDGTSDIAQADAFSFLGTLLLPAAGAFAVPVADSSGEFAMDFSGGSLIFAVGVAPTPTVEGQAVWDSTNDHLVIGDGAGQVTLLDDGSQAGGDATGTFGALQVVDLTITGEAQGDLLYRNGTNWVRLPAGTAGQVLRSGGVAANPSWVDIGTLAARVDNITLTSSAGAPYIESTSATYETLAHIGFLGTDQNTPTQIAALIGQANPGTIDVRIQDITNGLTIAEITGVTGAALGLTDLGTLSNLSATAATWVVQVSKVGGGNKARCGGLSVVY
jgi:hypothetical protein